MRERNPTHTQILSKCYVVTQDLAVKKYDNRYIIELGFNFQVENVISVKPPSLPPFLTPNKPLLLANETLLRIIFYFISVACLKKTDRVR